MRKSKYRLERHTHMYHLLNIYPHSNVYIFTLTYQVINCLSFHYQIKISHSDREVVYWSNIQGPVQMLCFCQVTKAVSRGTASKSNFLIKSWKVIKFNKLCCATWLSDLDVVPLLCQTKFLNYTNAFWQDCVTMGESQK